MSITLISSSLAGKAGGYETKYMTNVKQQAMAILSKLAKGCDHNSVGVLSPSVWHIKESQGIALKLPSVPCHHTAHSQQHIPAFWHVRDPVHRLQNIYLLAPEDLLGKVVSNHQLYTAIRSLQHAKGKTAVLLNSVMWVSAFVLLFVLILLWICTLLSLWFQFCLTWEC